MAVKIKFDRDIILIGNAVAIVLCGACAGESDGARNNFMLLCGSARSLFYPHEIFAFFAAN